MRNLLTPRSKAGRATAHLQPRLQGADGLGHLAVHHQHVPHQTVRRREPLRTPPSRRRLLRRDSLMVVQSSPKA